MKTAGLALLVLNLALVGCASRAKPTPGDTAPKPLFTLTAQKEPEVVVTPVLKTFAGTRWIVLEINGTPVTNPLPGWDLLSLDFDKPGTGVTGHGGVNRFAGRYSWSATELSFGPLAKTRRSGPSAQMEVEQIYTEALSRVVAWRQAGSNLVLLDSGSKRVLLLARAVD